MDFCSIVTTGKARNDIPDFSGEKSETVEQATIVFTDIVSSTDLVNRLGDAAARDIFRGHDKIIRNKLKKYKGTELQNLGDGFMLSFESATLAIKCACAIQREIAQNLPQIHIRIGINTGPVIGSIVGIHKYVYDIFGPGVNLAARMESLSETMQITLCEETHRLINDEFLCTPRGEFEIKGFGHKQLYFLEREHER